eukprot:3425152-Rhodomonas_salina.1
MLNSSMCVGRCNTRPGVVSEFGALGFEDEDECDSGTHNCDDNAECINTDGSFACPCNEGYHNVGAYACADDDECASGAHACAPNAACLNTDGNYTCVCAANFFGSGESNCTACPYDLVSPQVCLPSFLHDLHACSHCHLSSSSAVQALMQQVQFVLTDLPFMLIIVFSFLPALLPVMSAWLPFMESMLTCAFAGRFRTRLRRMPAHARYAALAA